MPSLLTGWKSLGEQWGHDQSGIVSILNSVGNGMDLMVFTSAGTSALKVCFGYTLLSKILIIVHRETLQGKRSIALKVNLT